MKEEDMKSIKFFQKRLKKNPNYRFFVASKTGGNARGIGENRSVILGSNDGKNWYQADKVWGMDNEKRANEIVRMAKSKKSVLKFTTLK